MTAAGTSSRRRKAERRRLLNERLVSFDALGVGRDSTAFAPGTGNPTAAQAIVEQQMTELEMRMLRKFESLDRDQRGFGTADALLSIVQSLAMVPGRKTLVYLSEGLPASPAMQARLDGLVSAANRANVAVYTIDAAGLRTESTLTETRREVGRRRAGAAPPVSVQPRTLERPDHANRRANRRPDAPRPARGSLRGSRKIPAAS